MLLAVHKLTRLKITDNSGAKLARCLYNYRTSLRKGSKVGDIVLVVLKYVLPNKKVKKGELFKAVITCSSDKYVRFSGHTLKPFGTRIILINSNSMLPRAKRSRDIMLEEVRTKFSNGIKVISLAPLVI